MTTPGSWPASSAFRPISATLSGPSDSCPAVPANRPRSPSWARSRWGPTTRGRWRAHPVQGHGAAGTRHRHRAGRGLRRCDGAVRVELSSGRALVVTGAATDELQDHDRDFLRSLAHIVDTAWQRHAAAAQLEHLASHDPLPGVPNRTLFLDRLGQARAACQRSGARYAVLFLDLDGLKSVNDGAGHEAGDEVLRLAADRLPPKESKPPNSSPSSSASAATMPRGSCGAGRSKPTRSPTPALRSLRRLGSDDPRGPSGTPAHEARHRGRWTGALPSRTLRRRRPSHGIQRSVTGQVHWDPVGVPR
ncbi:diguanylate cyclase [Egibacter rhizosphaerae]|uniref:diguanylate cyclase n=1 Tax=Egibacter rhizosphaerae TaxID=1670831 RepID=UPI00267A10C9